MVCVTRFQVTPLFVATVRSSRQRCSDLARAVGLPPVRFSGHLNGTSFGPQTARRIRAMGPLLGLAEDHCCHAFRDPMVGLEAAS
jgi:hypothetical protein